MGVAIADTTRPLGKAGRRPRSAARWLLGLLPVAAFIAIWQLVGSESSVYFPVPSTWATAIDALIDAGLFWPAVTHTVLIVVLSLTAAAALGLCLGLLVGLSPSLRRALRPILEFLRMIPPPAVVPVAILLLGVSDTMAVVVVAFTALWPVMLNAEAGVRSLSPVLLDVSDALRLSSAERVRKIIVPAIVPNVAIGVRIAAPIAVVVELLVEMLTNVGGLGALLITAQRTFNAAQAFGLLAVVGVVGVLINAATNLIEHQAMRARGETST